MVKRFVRIVIFWIFVMYSTIAGELFLPAACAPLITPPLPLYVSEPCARRDSYLEVAGTPAAAAGLEAVARARKMCASVEQEYLAILKKDPTGKKGMVWFKLGQLYGALGKDEGSRAKAVTAFKRAADANPESERFRDAAVSGEWKPLSSGKASPLPERKPANPAPAPPAPAPTGAVSAARVVPSQSAVVQGLNLI